MQINGAGRVTVRKNPLMYANVSITGTPGASVFRVHGGGFVLLRVANTFGTARRVADALRRSPSSAACRPPDSELPPAGCPAGGSSVPLSCCRRGNGWAARTAIRQ